jgi:DnaJ-class molecular chaperone
LELATHVIRFIRAQIHAGSDGWIHADRARGRQRQTRAHGPGHGSRNTESNAQRIDPELAELYSNLEVPYGSSLATVRKAWIRLLRKYHPDLHSQDLEKRKIADELTQRLNGAYERLRKRSQSETNRQEK